jgi:hypothetical protein
MHAKQPLLSAAKSVPNCHCYLQMAVTPDYLGSIALLEHMAFLQGRRNSCEDLNIHLFLMNKKGLSFF